MRFVLARRMDVIAKKISGKSYPLFRSGRILYSEISSGCIKPYPTRIPMTLLELLVAIKLPIDQTIECIMVGMDSREEDGGYVIRAADFYLGDEEKDENHLLFLVDVKGEDDNPSDMVIDANQEVSVNGYSVEVTDVQGVDVLLTFYMLTKIPLDTINPI